MMRRVLVTGGAGFIGSHLVQRLAGLNVEVVVLDNLHRSDRSCLPPECTFIEGDIRNPSTLHQAIERCDTVFHLAAQSSVLSAVTDLTYSVSTNVTGTVNVLEAARAAGVRRVVFASSREVYGETERFPVSEDAPLHPKNSYGASKAAAEMYCRIYSSPEVIVLRLANVYGPHDRDRVIPLFIENALAGRPLTIFGSGKLLDLVWIDDVVTAFCRAAEAAVAGRVINIGSGNSTPLETLAERIIALTASKSEIVHAPARQVEINKFQADIRRAGELLGYAPQPQQLYGLDRVVASFSPRA